MEFLKFLEGLRNPVLDAFFGAVTHLGEETFFIIFGIIIFWCINKKEGYYILTVGFMGTVINQFLKLLFRIPRPWVRDKSFTIVESARAEATGYSFPSGHTQSSMGVFGSLARWHNNLWLRTITVALCILVPFSRLYLGVHTPLDVGVSAGVALILIFGIYPIIKGFFENKRTMRILFGVMFLMSLAYLLFTRLFSFPADVDAANLQHGTENAYKMAGCTLGVIIGFEIDSRFTDFDTSGNIYCQLLKLVCGIIPLLLIKEGLKAPLGLIFGDCIAHLVRYLLLVVFVMAVWPLTFRFFKKITKSN